jgi:hypothetical protein
MLTAVLSQQYPALQVEGEADPLNSGNFVVRTLAGQIISPYGFVDTTARRRDLLEKIAELD